MPLLRSDIRRGRTCRSCGYGCARHAPCMERSGNVQAQARHERSRIPRMASNEKKPRAVSYHQRTQHSPDTPSHMSRTYGHVLQHCAPQHKPLGAAHVVLARRKEVRSCCLSRRCRSLATTGVASVAFAAPVEAMIDAAAPGVAQADADALQITITPRHASSQGYYWNGYSWQPNTATAATAQQDDDKHPPAPATGSNKCNNTTATASGTITTPPSPPPCSLRLRPPLSRPLSANLHRPLLAQWSSPSPRRLSARPTASSSKPRPRGRSRRSLAMASLTFRCSRTPNARARPCSSHPALC